MSAEVVVEVLTMTVTLDSELEAKLSDYARVLGKTPEDLAVAILREKLIRCAMPVPQDEWERRLFGAAKDYGVSLSDWAVSSEGIYE